MQFVNPEVELILTGQAFRKSVEVSMRNRIVH